VLAALWTGATLCAMPVRIHVQTTQGGDACAAADGSSNGGSCCSGAKDASLQCAWDGICCEDGIVTHL
jgi:hypothetical protein